MQATQGTSHLSFACQHSGRVGTKPARTCPVPHVGKFRCRKPREIETTKKEKVGKASFSRRLFHHYPAGSHPYYMDVDDDDDMQRALAMSMEAARLPQGTAPAADDADADADDDMSKALAMSMESEPAATADDDDDMAKA